MAAKFKRIHMPKPLYDEVESFVQNSYYEKVGKLCGKAGKMLIEHYNLR
jgi:hypothetical protein